ncbi:MAG TPA: NAD(+) synthase, partial [Rickettsiales bacterium]|nr:NAD(+) synthase [Rickettsiales bacterium]
DALVTAKNLGLDLQIISIEEIFEEMLKTLENQGISALAKENIQSRIRGNILMALSNSSGALLLSTGNKSELAVGYSTIYGDMCGAFNPLKDLYKTQIYELAKWRNSNSDVIAPNILVKEPTAELRENQKDSDSLPPYKILDKILYQLIEEQKSVENIVAMGYNQELVKKIVKLLQNSEFKRQQAPLGVKLSTMSFDRDWRYPIANSYKL